MNSHKWLISTASALAVVGTIGFAYAQSTEGNATAPITPGQTQPDMAAPTAPTAEMPTSPSMQGNPAAGSGSAQGGASPDMPSTTAAPDAAAAPAAAPAPMPMDAMPTERAARADRN